MRRCLAGALVAILGACAWQLRPQAPPALTTARVRLTAGQPTDTATRAPLAVALGQIDLAPTGRWVAALRASQAIEWASGLAHAQDQRRFVMDHHAPTVPASPGAYTRAPRNDACPYAALIRSIWQRDAEWAIGIAWRESRCIPTAYNPSGAEGLFQLLGHADLMPCDWRDPVCNVTGAWRLYEGSGRAPWSL